MQTTRRRWLMQLAALGAVPTLPGCLWNESSAQPARPATLGTNLSGMEWTQPGIRRGASTLPNLHFTVPRKADIAWLAQNGLRKNRLPVLWEMLQPVLFDSRPNAATRALVGEPGELHAQYAQFITDVLDAHAAVGARCILDLHNYCRYRDFRYQPDGSVAGLQKPPTPQHRAYTDDGNAVVERIFSLAPGATLTQAQFADVWTRAARRWKDHPGLAGYGLMNEPHDLPAPGRTEQSEGGGEDLAIWPAYARAAVAAIRQVDARTPIYVASNGWSQATALAEQNPGFPLQGSNLVYEVHLYLDAASSGHAFDYDSEARKGYSAGLGKRAIEADTGARRLEQAVRWARKHDVQVALTEVGMPLDDARWQEMFLRTAVAAVRSGVEIYSWMGGAHWPIRNHALNHVPGWYQDRTLVPAVAGPMLQAAGVARATLYDEGAGMAPAGQPVTVTVSARGSLAQPLALTVASDAGGNFSKTALTIPAGANGADSFTFTPPAGKVA
ncbi:MAG TPA: cellulase family glycosylhydrolase, partial [Ramlibacter sp.]